MLGPNHLSIYGGCGAGGFGGCPAVDGWLMTYNEQSGKRFSLLVLKHTIFIHCL